MHLLIDTNILIYREDDQVIAQNVSDLFELLNIIPADIFTHPSSITDIKRDPDQRRRDVILSKIRIYRQLENPPSASKDPAFLALVGQPRKQQDNVDNEILYAVKREAVDFLITEDSGIHRKAFAAGIGDRVLHIDDALQFFKKFLPKKERISPPPALKEGFMYQLDLNDPIFDSLKHDYPGFEDWFREKSKEHRKCYVSYREDGTIGALLIYKFEDEKIDVIPPLPQKKRLKIATLKVTHVGNKIGERLLKISIDLAIQNDCDEIYLTHFTEENDRLVELITEYGFQIVGLNTRGEEIFLKKLIPSAQDIAKILPDQIFKRFYPSFYDGPLVKKWIIPIQPEFHSRLFTDFGERQTTLPEHSGQFIVEGNTIKKAYLSHPKTKSLAAGDVVLFYRSHDKKAITSVGIVEGVRYNLRDTDEIIRFVGKRSVYTRREIETFNKPLTAMLFRHHFHFKNPLDLNVLLRATVLSGAPQSTMQINDEKYKQIKQIGGIDGRFTID